ncbi:MAG: hypothetical protein ACRDD2_06935 [Sarcina sp.]
MVNLNKLENELTELRLRKRSLILAGKEYFSLDEAIKEIEIKIKAEKDKKEA